MFIDMNCTHYTKKIQIKRKQNKQTKKESKVARTILGQSLFKIIYSSMKYSYRKYKYFFSFYVTGIQYKSDFKCPFSDLQTIQLLNM